MKSLLSIQSHVVHGYVGGKAAVFPLQTLGWDVDVINTVNFSNHTGYGSVKGTKLSHNEVEDLFQGINNINIQYDAIITGYIPNSGLISQIAENIIKLKAKRNSLYLMDPVLGDQGYLYVDESCILEYRKLLQTKIVDIIKPNQFELELLCDTKINTLCDLKNAIELLHNKYGVKYVVVSSVTNLESLDDNYIYCAFSSIGNPVMMYKVPIIKSYFTGVGDLFSALLMEKIYESSSTLTNGFKSCPLDKAVNQVLTIMAQTLKLTHQLGLKQFEAENSKSSTLVSGKINDGNSMKYFELKVIQARDFFSYSGNGDYKAIKL